MSSLPAGERRDYIDARLNSDWGWAEYKKQDGARSIRQIADAVKRGNPQYNRPSNMTIQRDIEWLVAKHSGYQASAEETSEAQRLLTREGFPEWREQMFTTPEGKPFETPVHQLAAFEVLYSLTYKEILPQWVIEYLDRVDPNHPLPENINELILSDKHFLSFELLMAPRHGKTELMIHFIIFVHCKSPEKRIMFGNGTEKKTMSFIANFIMPVLETHEKLNALYGPFRGALAWAKDGYILAKRPGFSKMPSLQPYGLRGSVRSFDTDLIIGDDLSDYKRAISETTTVDDAEWVRTELMSRRETAAPFFNTGSHLPIETGDIFVHIEDKLEDVNNQIGNQVFLIKKIPAHNYENCQPEVAGDPGAAHGDWCVLWPSIRPWFYLEGMRGLMADDVMFEAVYNQVPASKEMMHFPKDVVRHSYANVDFEDGSRVRKPPTVEDGFGILDHQRSWKEVPICCKGQKVLVAAGFDPAYSKQKRAAFSAISVKGACPHCGRRYLIDWWEGRQSAELHPTLIGSFTEAYPDISRVRIESVAAQKALISDPRLMAISLRDKFVIEEWNTDERKWDPVLGIPQSARHVKSGMYSVPYRTAADQEYAERVIRQLIRWPKRPNDWVMADWFAELSLKDMIDEYRYVSSETMYEEDIWSTEWHDEQQWEVDLADIHEEEEEGWDYV